MDFYGNIKPKQAELSVVVTRADGTKEDLGVVAYYSRNPIKRLWWKVKKWQKGKK